MGDFLLKLIRPDLAFSSIRDFLELGGDVLLALMLATFVMWILIIERYWHFATAHKTIASSTIDAWNKRSDSQMSFLHFRRVDKLPIILRKEFSPKEVPIGVGDLHQQR